MRTVGAPGMRVGPKAKRHTRGCPGSSGAPCHSNVVDCRPISGGGEPSTSATVLYATAQDAPRRGAATKAAMPVSQKRRAISRGGRIRTGDLLVPNQTRYRTALRPVNDLRDSVQQRCVKTRGLMLAPPAEIGRAHV